uniref:ribulose-phosphate 3-epimerase n=1 Tax=Ursus americanus TaxID=9643 RepID=A0A452RLG3_URSAM
MHLSVSYWNIGMKPMVALGANQPTSHVEDTKNPGALIKETWENEMKVRLTINLGTTVGYLAPWANQIDTISVMPVEPNFGRQKCMGDTMSRVHQWRTQCPSLDIEISVEVGGILFRSFSLISTLYRWRKLRGNLFNAILISFESRSA